MTFLANMLRSSTEGWTVELCIFIQLFFSSAVPLCCQTHQSRFFKLILLSAFMCWGRLWKLDLCFLTQSCQEFLYNGLATRKLCVGFFCWLVVVCKMCLERGWCVKCICSGISHTQKFCSPSKFAIAGGMAKWWASLPVVKPEHRLPKWAWCCFLSCLRWFVNPYLPESVILFLFLTLPLS